MTMRFVRRRHRVPRKLSDADLALINVAVDWCCPNCSRVFPAAVIPADATPQIQGGLRGGNVTKRQRHLADCLRRNG